MAPCCYQGAASPVNHIEIILKVAERCNLNCRYCYFFNKENKDFEDHPALIATDTIHHLVRFLRSAPYDLSETIFQIDIHGGEPLLMGTRRFSAMVSLISDGLHDAQDVRFTVQTNAVLINDAWINVFEKHNIFVGISVDGTKAHHDANRIDRRGRGTYDSMVPKIAAIKKASSERRIPGFGSICVVTPESDGRDTYIALACQLGFDRMQFLFPDDTHDSFNVAHTAHYVKFVEDIFDCWEHDNRKVRIKLFDQTMRALLHDKTLRANNPGVSHADIVVFTVSSAGDLGHDDTLRNVVPELFNSGMNVSAAAFPKFLAWHKMISRIVQPSYLATSCAACGWRNVCEDVSRSYTPLHRMQTRIANQPSIYCEALQKVYGRSASYLSKRGVPIQTISQNLNTLHVENVR